MAISVVRGWTNRPKRDCFADNFVIASGAWRSRLFGAGQTDQREIASQARNDRIVLSSRARRNVPSGYGDLGCSGLDKQTKERLLRRLAMTKLLRHREEHGDLDCSCWRAEKRDCFVLRNDTLEAGRRLTMTNPALPRPNASVS